MKVLWIGNSHTFFHDMPQLTAMLYEAAEGESLEVTMLAQPAKDWAWHMEQYFEVRFNLKYGAYDYCFLQQLAHPFPDEEQTRMLGTQLADMCQSVGTKPVITTTWAKKAEPYNQQIMIDFYDKLAKDCDAIVSPVGKVWHMVRTQYPDIELYHKDGAHASVYGAYLNACCHYKVLTGKSCVGLPAKGIDFIEDITQERIRNQVTGVWQDVKVALDEKTCAIIQQIVDSVI